MTTRKRKPRNRSLLRRSLDTLPQRIAAQVAEHVSAWEHALSGTPQTRSEAKYEAPVFATIQLLVQYARDGSRPDDLDVEAMVIQQSALLDSPVTRATRSLSWIDSRGFTGIGADLVDVCCAAMARLSIERNEPVPRRWLAALAGVDVSWIKKSVQAGELVNANPRLNTRRNFTLPITPQSAREYLLKRGQSL